MTYVYAAIVAALLAIGGYVGYQFGVSGKADAEIQLAQVQQQYAQASLKASEDARKAEQAKAEAINKIAQSYEKGKQDAQAKSDAVVAGLESGAIKLRKQWASCATDSLSDSAASAAGIAEQDRLRRESIGRILGWTGKLQAQRDALIDVVIEDRK